MFIIQHLNQPLIGDLLFFSCIKFIYVMLFIILILWQGDHGHMPQAGRGKSPMVMHEVNVSLIVPNSINVIVTKIHDYITYVNI